MSWEEKDVLDNIDSSNIFDEFETWELKDEINANKSSEKRNLYDYLSIVAGIFSVIFWLSIFLVAWVYIYVTNQENIELDDSSLFSPICGVFLGDTPNTNNNWNCASISFLESDYSQKLSKIKTEQFWEIVLLLEEIYKSENFIKSKEVVFLESITQNKLRPLVILDAFDKLKYNYDTNLQERIQCENFSISNEWILTASCEAFSGWYETDIKWYDGTDGQRISWTSISVANSFLNYIEKQSDDFIIIDRQKVFSSEWVFSEYSYITKKTSFELTLQYSNNTLISN